MTPKEIKEQAAIILNEMNKLDNWEYTSNSDESDDTQLTKSKVVVDNVLGVNEIFAMTKKFLGDIIK